MTSSIRQQASQRREELLTSEAKPPRFAVKPDNIPKSLKEQDRWVCWVWFRKDDKWTKKPIQPDRSPAASNDSNTWTNFKRALSSFDKGFVDGVGFVLGSEYVGIDIDCCCKEQSLTPIAERLIDKSDTYVEFSPTGTGIKLIVKGSEPRNWTNNNDLVDIYSNNRYFTITGHTLGENREIAECNVSELVNDGFLSAVKAMLKVPIEDTESDGSKRLIKYAHQAVKHGLDEIDAVDAIQTVLDEHPTPKNWDFDDILKRVRQAEQRATKEKQERDAKRYETEAIKGSELLRKRITRTYLIDKILVKDEPMVIGGPSKTLKTSIALDMAVSLVSGQKFLGQFDVPNPTPVMIVSGESGESTIQSSLQSIVDARGIDPDCLDRLEIGFKLPKLDDPNCVDDLIKELDEKKIKLVIIDPLYRSLRVGDQASNIYSMGAQLELIAERIHKAGITTILLHHFRKTGRTYTEAPELEDLSQSGMAEFGRQFILLKRREAYEQDGNHKLWFVWGGSAGHQGQGILEAFDGVYPERTWQVTLRRTSEYEAARKESKTVEKETKKDDLRERILEVIGDNPGIKTTELVEQVHANRNTVANTLEDMSFEMLINFESGKRGAKLWYKTEN